MRLSIFLAVILAGTVQDAEAQLLADPSERWVVLASRENLDEAVGVASVYQWRFDEVRVVRASNGWLAIIAGPVPIPDGVKAAKQELLGQGGLPGDLFFSNGAEFEATQWSPEAASFPSIEASASKHAEFAHGNLDVFVDTVPADGGIQYPRIKALRAGREVFSSVLQSLETTEGASTINVVPLDPVSDSDEIVLSGYWGGAHCCTVAQIFSQVGGDWQVTDAATLDGGGYWFQDLDDDGSAELVSVDNSFLYAFSPYAYSMPPRVVEQLRSGAIVDKRHDPAFTTFYRRDLYRLEHMAELDPSMWKSNGFLAGWAATKALVGEFDEAWAKIVVSHDRVSGWPMQVCTIAVDLADCPETSRRDASFPEALKQHLEVRGYLEAPTPPQTWNDTPRVNGDTLPPGRHLEQENAPDRVVRATPEYREPEPEQGEGTGSSGTGFFVSAQGDILTNHHVIEGCRQPTVLRSRSIPLSATIVATDATNDLALLKADFQTDEFASLALTVRLGEAVATFGYPLSSVLSSGGNFTLGNVTALAGLMDDTRYLQISAPVQPGNSGGPLLDHYGNVTGVVTAKFNALAAMLVTGDIPQNINFAIRSSTAAAFLSAHGVDVRYAVAEGQEKLDAPDLAERAAEFSVAIQC